jgi:cysteinyl-tRNA synthetase
MYVCGITPYDECHLGHAMSYIVFDTIRRYLEFRGHRVKYVQNFTDVDDKIIERARIQGVSIAELSSRFIDRYFADMDALNIRRADVYPRATEEIPRMLEIIRVFMDKGYAYESRGSIYFRVSRFPGYGKLSGRDLSSMEPAEDAETGKESPHDFALWKASKPGEPSWPSPWGEGRPGWHIECTAMSLGHLGDRVDIHGGGRDLIFPHHENEIAQSESFTGSSPFVRYWLHNGMVQIGEEKMSKSLGNLVTVSDLLKRYTPDAIRLLVLSSHYRSPLTYTEEGLQAAERGVERLRGAARRRGGDREPSIDASAFHYRFVEAMDDDFNTPQAIAVLFDLCRQVNRGAEEGLSISRAQETLSTLAGVLGLTLREPETEVEEAALQRVARAILGGLEGEAGHGTNLEAVISHLKDVVATPSSTPQEIIDALVKAREGLRLARAWQQADAIRSHLAELGLILKDTPQGTVWQFRKSD